MGHLINPIAFRMGWFSTWVDDFYSNYKYYPEFLHLVFRMRLYFSHYFISSWFEKLGFFYSHFYFIKQYHGLSAYFFFYNGKLEAFCDDFSDIVFRDRFIINNQYKERIAKEKEKNKFIKGKYIKGRYVNGRYVKGRYVRPQRKEYKFVKPERKSRKFFKFYVILLIFFLYKKFLILKWPRRSLKHSRIEFLARAFFLFDKQPLLTYLRYLNPRHKRVRIKKNKKTVGFSSLRIKFFYFYLLCRTMAIMSDRNHSKGGLPNEEAIQRLMFVYSGLVWYRALFTAINVFLAFIYATFSYGRYGYMYTHFLVISNANITAKFISRFIARKLEQNFPLRSVLYPIKRELVRVTAIQRDSISKGIAGIQGYKKLKHSKTFFSSLFRSTLAIAFGLHRKLSYTFFLCNKSHVTYDLFLFLSSFYNKYILRKQVFCKGLRTTVPLISSCGLFRLVGFTKNFFLHHFYFILFFVKNVTSLQNLQMDDLFFNKKAIVFKLGSYNLRYLISEVISSLYSSFEQFFLWKKITPMVHNWEVFFSFSILLGDFIRNRYSQQYYYFKKHWIIATKATQRRGMRIAKPVTYQGIKGFKIQCLGRFTRKQRSARIGVMEGTMPLNTMSALIDYGAYSIVLKNSVINVKVWFHKDQGFIPYFYNLL